MSANYALRMSYGLQADPGKTQAELLALCQATKVDEIVLMIFAETYNNGHETLEEIRSWMNLIRPWKQSLQNTGVSVSLNPWHSLLHCDRGRTLKQNQSWQTMVDWRGQPASAVVCPLDPLWQAYYKEVLSLFAAEGFRVIWLDDDIRLANHAPLDWGGCWCPLHVAEYNRRTGSSATREQIVQACMQPGEPHPWREAWLNMWDETQLALVAEFHQVLELSGVKLGLMSSGPMMHAMEGRRWSKWWEALNGAQSTPHRLHFSSYSDALGSSLPLNIHMLDMNRSLERQDAEIDPEIENFPHGWNRSLRQSAVQMVLSQVFGADHLYLSLYDYLGNPPDDFPEVGKFLSNWKPALDWLSDLFPRSMQSQGVGCPWSEDQTRRKHAKPGAASWMDSLFCATHGWPAWLGGFGVPFQMRMSATVNALGGEMAWAFSEEEILRLLEHGLLLDGPAARILQERGFGRYIGLGDIHLVSQKDSLFTIEELTDPRFTSRVGALIDINDKPCTQQIIQGTPLPGAEVISALRDPKFARVGHGVVIYANELGGRIGICPWDINAPEANNGQRTRYRSAQMQALVKYTNRGEPFGCVNGAPWLVSQFFSDGKRWRGVIWNAFPDAVREIQVDLPSGMKQVSLAVQLSAEGKRTPAEWSNHTIHLTDPLHQWECVVLQD
jgi:hypothetical protein